MNKAGRVFSALAGLLIVLVVVLSLGLPQSAEAPASTAQAVPDATPPATAVLQPTPLSTTAVPTPALTASPTAGNLETGSGVPTGSPTPEQPNNAFPGGGPTVVGPGAIAWAPDLISGETGAPNAAPTVVGRKISDPVPTPTVSADELGAQPTGTKEPLKPLPRIKATGNVAPSPRYDPIPLTVDSALESQVRAMLGDTVAGYGIVVKRLADGRGIALNPDKEFYAASLFKALVMYEVFKQRDLGMLRFDDTLEVLESYRPYSLGWEDWLVGQRVPISELLYAAITVSDNVAAVMLLDRTGGWNVIADMKAIGLQHTTINGDHMPTSAGDMAMFLEMIATGNAISHTTSQEMISLLSHQKINDRLPALLPAGTTVAHKTGNWTRSCHDVGVVYAPHGAYVIAVLSENPDAGQTIAQISRLVYEAFEGPVS